MNNNLLLGVIFTLVGGLLVVIGLFIFIRTRLFISKAQEVKGTVTRMIYSRSSDSSGYAPVFAFTTLQGQKIEVADSLYSNPPQFKVGQVIDVLYDPENPNSARVKKWFNLYFAPLLLGGMGIIFGGIGIVIVVGPLFKYLF